MKRISIILIFAALAVYSFGQENLVTLSGGFSFANIENTDMGANGWRINGSYEFNPMGGPWAVGLSVGYIGLSASETIAGIGNRDYTIGTVPIYVAPKYMFGSDKIKGFIKGALGTHSSHFKRTGAIELTDTDWGFYGGGSAGVKIFFTDKIFVNVEYELAWLSNTSYKEGLINSVMAGIGVKF